MANQHSHSLRDTSRSETARVSSTRVNTQLIITGLLVCLVIAAIVMVVLNPNSAIQRGALAIAIVALATVLSFFKRESDFVRHRSSDHKF